MPISMIIFPRFLREDHVDEATLYATLWQLKIFKELESVSGFNGQDHTSRQRKTVSKIG